MEGVSALCGFAAELNAKADSLAAEGDAATASALRLSTRQLLRLARRLRAASSRAGKGAAGSSVDAEVLDAVRETTLYVGCLEP